MAKREDTRSRSKERKQPSLKFQVQLPVTKVGDDLSQIHPNAFKKGLNGRIAHQHHIGSFEMNNNVASDKIEPIAFVDTK